MSTARSFFAPEPPPDPRPTHRPATHRLRRILAWFMGVSTLLFLVTTITVIVLLNSQGFHNYVLSKAQSAAAESLGAQVQLQNYALHLSPLGLDVYGVTIHGAAPYANIPLLQVQHAQVGVGITSVLQKKWYLSSIRVDHPVVQVFVDKNGASNIPKPKSSNSKSNTSIFDLGIRHAILDQGEIYYNAQKSALAADVHDLNFQAGFDVPLKMYSGHLAYSNGRVLFGAYEPFEHNFDARFDVTPSTFQLHHATLSSGNTRVNLAATATNFNAPVVRARYSVDLDGAQMARMLKNPSIPTGAIRATGTAQYEDLPNQPLLATLTVNGDLTSRQLLVKTSSVQAAIESLSAHYALDHGNATLHDLRAGLLGGEVNAQGTIKDLAGTAHAEMTAGLHNISLGEAMRLAGSQASSQPVKLSGVLNADAKASWDKSLDNLAAHTDASIHGAATGKETARSQQAGTLPIESEIHATYTGANKQIALQQSYLRLPQTSLTMNGVVSNRSSLALRLQANDLREVATLAGLFSTPKPGQPPPPALDLAGQANFQGTVQGSTSAPHLAGQLSASNLRVNGTAWKVFRTNVDASPTGASLRNADLEPQAKGRITFNASTGLHKWAFTKDSPIQVDLNASQMDVADLVKLAGQQIPVTGTLNTHVTLHGTELNPIGNGNVSLTKVVAYNEPISTIQVTFNGTGDEAHADLDVQLPAGSVKSNVSVRPKEKTYTAQLSSGGIDLTKLETLKAKNVDATGVVAINAHGQGSFDNPQLTAAIQIPTLVIQKQTVKNINLDMDMANHVANATLNSTAVNTSIRAKARVNLTGDYDTDASIDTQGIPLQPIVAAYSPAQAATLSGQTELHATVRGPIKNKAQLEAHLNIPYLNLDYNNTIKLASQGPIKADYKNGVLDLQRGEISGTETELHFQGSIPVIDRSAPMSLVLQGDVNLRLAQLFDPTIRSSGNVRFNINSHGATGRDIGGEIDIVDANYASGDLPVGLQHGNGALTLTTDRINIKSFQGTVGGGTVIAQGGVAYRPAIQFNLGLAAKNIRMLYPQGMREAVDADIRLVGTTENATLGGTVNLADISFTPAFDLDNFIGQFSSGVTPPPSQGFAQNVNLNLALHSTNNVNLVSSTVSINGSANLQVRGTAADPVILGRVNLTGGDVILHNDRFVLTGGTIQFVNPSQTEPVLNVGVKTTIQQYDISMRFTGPASQMQTQYNSDPALPQADILNLLAFGQTSGAAAGQTASNEPSTPVTQQAASLVASQVSSQITSRISKVAGISQLSISPVLGNATGQGAGANITIQQRVTGNLFVTFSTNTATTQSEVIQGQYQITPKVALSATRDPNGGFAVDTLIKKTW
ncbi:AsmA family protein [Acidobacteria bacterium AB60]|nr:AsmA family protein [Acidobacteria bacterium AB60]